MSPLVDHGRLIVHVGGHDQGPLIALDVADGEVAWTWDGDGPAYSSPIVAELSGTRQIITQTQNACVGVAAETGELLWKIAYKTEFDQNAVTPVVYEQSVICSGYNRGIDRYRIEKQGDEWLTDRIWDNKEVSLYMSTPGRQRPAAVRLFASAKGAAVRHRHHHRPHALDQRRPDGR